MTRPMRAGHALALVAALPPSPGRDAAIRSLAGGVDWPMVERAAVDWGLAPLAGRGLAGVDGIPPALVERCRSIERLTAVRNALLLHHARGAERLADGLGVPLVRLKGADLMASVYPGPGCRVSGDLDLLARESDCDRIEAALRAAGWRADDAGRDWYDRHLHHGHPWTSPDGAVTMELHWALVRPDDPFTFDAPAVIDRCRRLPAARAAGAAHGAGDARRLDAADAVLFLAAHAIRHLDAPDAAYRSLVDLAWQLAAEPALDARATAARARAQRLDRVLAAALAWWRARVPDAGDPAAAALAGALGIDATRDTTARDCVTLMERLSERAPHRPPAVASGVTGFWQRSGRARWAFLVRGLAPDAGAVDRDLRDGQRGRPLPLRYLALLGNYLDEARRLGPGGLSAAATLGRLRRRLAEPPAEES
jgi:hypothetical protein